MALEDVKALQHGIIKIVRVAGFFANFTRKRLATNPKRQASGNDRI
jgi:hypothetical protein